MALIENDLPTAYAYMKKAIETEPLLADSWVNLSVVFGRNDQLDDAISVLQTALGIDGSQLSAMSNLYQVYIEQGNLQAAEKLENRVERYRQDNPYYLLHLSDEALALNQYEESTKLLQRAIKKKDDDHQLHFALAKTQYLSGETMAAENSLSRARELAPRDMMAYYERPLGELVEEAQLEDQLEALLGGDIPQDRTLDGVDQSDFLMGKTKKSARESMVIYLTSELFGAKWRNWKILLKELDDGYAIKKIAYPSIYNLIIDPKEEEPEKFYLDDTWVDGPLWQVIEEHQASMEKDSGAPDG